MSRPRSAALAFLALAAGGLAGPVATRAGAERESGPEGPHARDQTPFDRAREEQGPLPTPRSRFSVPDGTLRVTPNQLLAASPGQKLHFEVALSRRVPGATLVVTLPRRWLELPASGIRATRPARLAHTAAGHARLRRGARTVELQLSAAGAGQTASFDVEDLGIPAGTYRLPFAWRDARGRTTAAGTATVVFFARVREGGQAATALARLANPGIATDVSGDAIEESETFIAVTPGNKNRIAVGVNWQNASMPGFVSDDGGQTWTKVVLPQTIDAPGKTSNESGDVCCDPTLTADSAGNFWFGGLSLQKGSAPGRAIVNRIAAGTDALQAVTTGLPVRAGAGSQDKPMMTIDNTPSSPTFGRLYVVWDELTGGGVNVLISQCDTRVAGVAQAPRCDNADNWSPPVTVTPTAGSYIYPDVATGPDGRAYVTWWDYSNVNAVRGDVCNPSTQNCAAATGWGTPQDVALLNSTGGTPVPFACPILAQPGGRASPAPEVVVDDSGGTQNGRVYVVWGDLRAGSGTTRCAENPNTGDGTPPLGTHLTFDAFVASAPGGALPGGASPSATVGTRLLTDGEGGGQANSDDWFPAIAVDQTSGQAWADFYSTRDDASRKTTNFYARAVTPLDGGGHSLGTLTRLSSAASDYSADPCCTFGNDYGDYTGITATQGIAYPVWSDNSGGQGEAFTFVAKPAPQAPGVTTGAASSIGQTSATVNGTVDSNGQATTYHFDYGPDASYGQSTGDASAPSGPGASPVSAGLTGLTAGATYHYRLVAHNASGTSQGSDRMFTTQSPPPTDPSAVTTAATNVAQDTASLNGTVNPNGTATSVHFVYGTSPGVYPSSTPSQSLASGTTDTPVSASVVGLTSGTTYYFRVVASHSGQTAVQGGELSFKTAAPSTPPPVAPAVTTGSASGITQSAATIFGAVNPNGRATSAWFDYGRTTAYGSTTPVGSAGSGTAAVARSADLVLLSAGTTYHYRIVASSSAGSRAGADRSFSTPTVFGLPPVTRDTTPPALRLSRRRVRLGRGGIVRIRLRCGAAEPAACAGVLRLTSVERVRAGSRRAQLRLGAARFRIRPGVTATVRVRLTRAARRLALRRGKLAFIAIARARDAAGNLGQARARIVLVAR